MSNSPDFLELAERLKSKGKTTPEFDSIVERLKRRRNSKDENG